jgi:DNA-binding XRE family transcriptional regulator
VSKIASKNKTAARLKQARESLGLTQEEFAHSIGLDKWFAVRDMESGKKIVTPEIAQEIERIHFINLRWLLTGREEMYLPPRGSLGDGEHEPSPEVSMVRDDAFTSIYKDDTLCSSKAAILISEAPEEFRQSLLLAVQRELFFLEGRPTKTLRGILL